MFDRDRPAIARIHAMRATFARLSDAELRDAASQTEDLPRWIALAATAAFRVLGQDMYDVQLHGALALARGSIAEMQTGEGKTLAAVPAISWFAREHRGVHVMTVNDYLARRDAAADDAGLERLPAGTQSAGGMPERVKCLHALVAHELAVPGANPFGREALTAAGEWWSRGCCVKEPS